MENTAAIKTEKQRNSAIELLRIIAMLMIVFHHFAVHGGFAYSDAEVSIPRLWYGLIMMGGKTGSNIFVLISGYFMIGATEKKVNISKIVKFWGQVVFYSFFLWLILGLMGIGELGIKSAISNILPISFSQWWFASEYFILLLISPFLNVVLNRLEKEQYQKVVLVLLVILSIIPTITTCYYQFGNTLWFVTLYSIAGYVRLHGSNRRSAKAYLITGMIFIALTFASCAIFMVLGTKRTVFAEHVFYFYGQEKFNIFIISYCLFRAFEKMQIKENKVINIISSATFGVYLIHDYPQMREVLWSNIFANVKYQNSPSLIWYSVLAVVVVFAVCSIIDLCRKKIIEPPFVRLVDKKIVHKIKFDKLFGLVEKGK